MKRNEKGECPSDAARQRDIGRRAKMEFGMAADAYRSEPDKKSTRNGAIAVQAGVAVGSFALTLAIFWLVAADINLAAICIATLVGITAFSSTHVTLDWERAVVLRLGKFNRVSGPGLFFTMPLIEYCTLRVDQRLTITPFGAEETLTSDLVPLDVDAVLSWMVWDPALACTEVEDYRFAVTLAAQTALRDALGRATVAEVVMRRNQLDQELRQTIEEKVSVWGISVVSVELRDIIVPTRLQNDLSFEAQVERRRNARIMLAEAERDIADLLQEVSERYKDNPTALDLRKMHLVHEGMRDNKASTVVVPSNYSEGFSSPQDAGN